MSYSSLPFTSKLFQLTSLTCALALAGCGGGDGDTVDSIAPAPDLGVTQPGTGGNGNTGGGNNGGGEQIPVEDFSLQKLYTDPTIIKLTDEPVTFNVTVKAVAKSGGAAINRSVSLSIDDSTNTGVTIQGASVQNTNDKGEAIYELKLNPLVLNEKQKADLIGNGFGLKATAKQSSDGSVLTQVTTISVRKDGSGEGAEVIESKLEIGTLLNTSSVSNNILNIYGDSAKFEVIIKNKDGARAQDVTVGLGIDSIKGIAIIGGNSKVTDKNGVVTFDIEVDKNLSKSERDALLKGVTYAVNIREKNGATKTKTGKLSVAIPVSDYMLNATSNSNKINAYGDTQKLTIKATPKNSKVPTIINGAKVSIKLNSDTNGISLSTNMLTLNANGQATVDLIVAPTLDAATRARIAKEGISYTVSLSEPNRSTTTKTVKSSVEIPIAKYDISFDNSSKKQLSSSGGTAAISFRVNDKNGGAIANQKVTASLPKALTDARLLTFDGAAEQITDAKGMVSYTVIVPAGLTVSQKETLEKANSFVLTATVTEATGASSRVSSEPIAIGSDIGQSEIALTAKSVPSLVSVLDEQFTLQVAGKRKDGSAAAGKSVKLIINKGDGATVVGNKQTTNDSGIATFKLNISQSLTPTQRDTLIKSGINYTAVLTDEDGTQSTITATVKVVQPSTSIKFASIITPSISEFGGSGTISVELATKNAPIKPIEKQVVAIQLGKAALDYGVTVNAASGITDFSGETTFIVTIPEGLTAEERTELKRIGINYQLSYIEKGVTYSETKKVVITTPDVDLTVINAPNLINNRPFYTLNGEGDTVVVNAGLSTRNTSFSISGQPIELEFANKELAALLNVNGKPGSNINIVDTGATGAASFTVIVPNNLNKDQKAALKNQKLTATLTETLTGKKQEIQFNIQSTKAAIDLIAIKPETLNLNGGEVQIEVIAKDSKDNVIEGQKVFLALPAAIASQGVILATSGTQTTNDSGKATYTIAVPTGLTAEQKKAIGNSFTVVLSAADANGNIATKISTVTTKTPADNGTQENLTIGANKVVNTKGDTFKVFVRVAKNIKDDITNEEKNVGIANREVRLKVDDPIQTGVTVTNNTATTNGDGVATFDLKLEDGANVNQAILEAGIKLTATTTTTENIKLVQNYIVAVDTATIDSYQIIASSDKSTLNTGGDQTNATIRVTDSKGGILAGVPVQLSIENLESSGAALTTPSMVTTDASGQIDVGVLLAANSINARLNHSVVINAKIVTPQYDANGNVSMQVREEKSLSLSAIGTQITLSASETNLQDGAPTTITTTLIDGAGRAITNATMELVNANGDVIAPSATATTDADGEAVFTINETDLSFDSNGNLRVFARALGEGSINIQRSLSSIDLVKVSQAGISFINIENVYNVDEPQLINVQIRADSAEQAATLVGKEVEVQTTIGSLISNYLDKFTDKVIVTKPIKATDIQGNIITVKVWLKSNLAGTAVLQATVLGENVNGQPKYQTTVDTRFRATTPAKMLFQAVKSVITPGGSTEVVATVKDKNDVPVEGQTVVFSRAADSSAGRLSAATAITDSKGEARVVYKANASSPIGGVIINARLLNDPTNIGSKTTDITVSEEAVYTTLAFANKLSSDDIYYTVRGSISVMDGSGRAVPNQEVSIKSYATHYAQGKVCLLDSTTTYQAEDVVELDEKGDIVNVTTPEPKTFNEKSPTFLQSGWISTEDVNYNYTLDKDEDINGNSSLDAINPVAIIGGTLSEDNYSFVTDEVGRADFEIRYPVRYSNWVRVQFDTTTFVNGSENTQTINYQLPSEFSDLSINGSNLITPWIDNASPFGTGGANCVSSMSVYINKNTSKTTVTLSPYSPNYSILMNGKITFNKHQQGFNSYIMEYNKAYDLGDIVTVINNGFDFSRVLKVE